MQTTSDVQPEITTWHRLEARELRLAVTHPPSNIFEEMIQWTEQGKLWHFPINNEQGLNRISMMLYLTCMILCTRLKLRGLETEKLLGYNKSICIKKAYKDTCFLNQRVFLNSVS